MLVLTRRRGEEVIIDGHIRVQVVAVQGDKVRLGITAPDGVVVDRQEVHDRRRGFEDGEVGRCEKKGHPPCREAAADAPVPYPA
jgi:carbon storage regulator